jgi:hypothetical protein
LPDELTGSCHARLVPDEWVVVSKLPRGRMSLRIAHDLLGHSFFKHSLMSLSRAFPFMFIASTMQVLILACSGASLLALRH